MAFRCLLLSAELLLLPGVLAQRKLLQVAGNTQPAAGLLGGNGLTGALQGALDRTGLGALLPGGSAPLTGGNAPLAGAGGVLQQLEQLINITDQVQRARNQGGGVLHTILGATNGTLPLAQLGGLNATDVLNSTTNCTVLGNGTFEVNGTIMDNTTGIPVECLNVTVLEPVVSAVEGANATNTTSGTNTTSTGSGMSSGTAGTTNAGDAGVVQGFLNSLSEAEQTVRGTVAALPAGVRSGITDTVVGLLPQGLVPGGGGGPGGR